MKRALLLCVALLLVGCGGSSSATTSAPASPSPASPSPTSPSPTEVAGTATATTVAARCDAPGRGVAGSPTLNVAYESVPGVDSNLTSLDIYPAAGGCAAPVVVWVHGGGYAVGDKSNAIADKARLFNDAGWTLVSVNYRLTTGRPGSAVYPDHYHDVAAAIGWVHDNIAAHGGDPSRIAVLGHSAGADIVSNVMVDPTYLGEVGMQLSDIACAAPLDTEGFDKPTAGANDPDGEKAQWKNALGNNPNYLTDTSATLQVKPGIGIPPMIGVVRGTADRRAIETAFLAKLAAAGIATTSIDASSLTHEEVNKSIGKPGDTVMTAPLMQFLSDCFG
jgi:arylformamidase